MKIERIEGRITVLSPLVHSEESYGNVRMFRRMKTDKGEIPYVSGNAIRGEARRRMYAHFLESLGITEKDLPITAVRFLKMGGSLEEGDEADYDTGFECRLRAILPAWSLFGGAVKAQLLKSKFDSLNAVPVCAETEFITGIKSDKHAVELLSQELGTRKDDREQKDSREDSAQMIYYDEVLNPGTVLYHAYVLRGLTDLERSAFGRMMLEMERWGTIGGKTATGHGRVKFEYDNFTPQPEAYDASLRENREAILAFLRSLTPPGKKSDGRRGGKQPKGGGNSGSDGNSNSSNDDAGRTEE